MECCIVIAKVEHESTKVSHDASFLTELEGMALNRYTAEDQEYMQEVNAETPAPPLVAPESRGGGGHRYNRGGRGRGGDWRQRDHSRDGGDWRQQRDHNRDGGDWRQQRDHNRDGRSGGGGGRDHYYNRENNRVDGGGYNRHYQQRDDNGHSANYGNNAGGGRGGEAGQYRNDRDGSHHSSGARGDTNSDRYRYHNSNHRGGYGRE